MSSSASPDPDLEKLSHGLTMGMVLSLPILLAGIALIVYAAKAGGSERVSRPHNPSVTGSVSADGYCAE